MSHHRKYATGRINKELLNELEALSTYYVVEYRIEGADNVKPKGLEPYRLILRNSKKVFGVPYGYFRIGKTKFGFKTQEDAERFKRIVEDSVNGTPFTAIVTITRVAKTS